MAQMIASFQQQVPQFVRDNMVDVLMPLKQDVMSVQAGQAKLEAKVDQLSKELNAVRVSHQSQRDAYSKLEGKFDKVTEALERLSLQHSASSHSASGAPQPRTPTHQFNIGTPRGGGPSGPHERAADSDEDRRTKLVKFPRKVHKEHMRAIYEKVKDRYFTAEMSASTLPNFPANGGTQFGVVFESRALAVEFSEQFEKDPMRYKPIGWGAEVTLRIGPPRTPEMKAKGSLLSPVYKVLDVGDRRGVIRPSYPRFGDPRTELSVPLESGFLKDVAVMFFEHVQGAWMVKGLEVNAEVLAEPGMADRLAVAAGVRPTPMGGGASPMDT